MRHWLVKSEPNVYSIDDLARDGRTPWDGVRNYQARNFMRDDMKPGDLVLFYHSSAEPMGVAGVARVASAPYADATAFDPTDDHFDPKSKPEDPQWMLVDLEFVEKFPRFVGLDAIKGRADLDGMYLTKRGMRLSVQPVTADHFEIVAQMGRGR